MKILSWDIEASGLNADFGIVLCVGMKEVESGKVKVLNILDYRDSSGDLIKAEKRLLKDVSGELLEADAWLTHFGTYYDHLFVNTRLLYHKLPTLPPKFPMIDTWKTAKYRLKLRNNRLITIQEFLGLETEKNAIRPEQWIRAMGGHRPSMDYIVDHCRRDVLVLEETYLRLRPLIIDHPNRNLIDAKNSKCSVCGSDAIQRRGYRITRTMRFPRYQCQNCGAWGSLSKGEKVVTQDSNRSLGRRPRVGH